MVREGIVGMWVHILPEMYSIWPRVRFSGSPLHSRALMPNREVKKERGRKLDRIIV